MVEGTPLLRVQTSKGSRGFESLRLRHFAKSGKFPFRYSRLAGLSRERQTNASDQFCRMSLAGLRNRLAPPSPLPIGLPKKPAKVSTW